MVRSSLVFAVVRPLVAVHENCKNILHIGNIQSIILRNYNFTAYLNMIIKFQVI